MATQPRVMAIISLTLISQRPPRLPEPRPGTMQTTRMASVRKHHCNPSCKWHRENSPGRNCRRSRKLDLHLQRSAEICKWSGITYTVSELTVPGYTTTIDDNYNITNSYTPGKTSATVTKIWNDARKSGWKTSGEHHCKTSCKRRGERQPDRNRRRKMETGPTASKTCRNMRLEKKLYTR